VAPETDRSGEESGEDEEWQHFLPLMEAIDYLFSDLALIRRALTHCSHGNESCNHAEHNERLEFLGDAVVDLVVGHHLMESLPAAREGQLSKLRAMVVREASLERAARELCLGDYLRLGRGEEQTGGRQKASILADAFEALVGAVYLDGGFSAAQEVVRRQLRSLAEAAVSGRLDRDHKTRLQELAQGQLHQVPRYLVTEERGPDHEKVFEVAVCLGERELARAEGHSKKEAEQSAAQRALEELGEV